MYGVSLHPLHHEHVRFTENYALVLNFGDVLVIKLPPSNRVGYRVGGGGGLLIVLEAVGVVVTGSGC